MGRAVIDEYFNTCHEVKPDFKKEFVSIFEGWLGSANLHKLDEVGGEDLERFNSLLRLLFRDYTLHAVDLEKGRSEKLECVDAICDSLAQNLNEEYEQFYRLIIPELGAVFTEEWDYTWILWHRDNGAVEALSPLIAEAGLHH